MILSPVLAFVLLAFSFRVGRRRWGSALLYAAVTWGVILTAITELLSLPHLLTPSWVAAAWGVAGVACAIVAWIRWRRAEPSGEEIPAVPLGRGESGMLLGVALIAGGTGLVALVAAPNNFDSMTYHLARVVHWAQNASVAYYPTSITRQLFQSPWAEFAILHLQLLSGGDRFASSVQWWAMLGSLLGVYLIGAQFGAERRTRWLSVVVCATIPMGILQASSTQNDYVATFWLTCFVYFCLGDVGPRTGIPGEDRAHWPAVGASLGLALLTKATNYLFAFPFLIWWCVGLLRRQHLRAARPLLAAASLTLLVNAGQYARNWDLYGNPLGPPEEQVRASNQLRTPAALASNLVRNAALHIGTPIGRVDRADSAAIERLHGVLGIASDDPRTTWAGTRFFVGGPSTHEDVAGNPLHLALIVGVLVALVAVRRLHDPLLLGYGAALTSAFVLFCYLMKWQPWHSRLHLALFVLASPLVALVLERGWGSRAAQATGGVLLAAALPWLILNSTRPLVGSRSVLARARVDQYFYNQVDLRDPYLGAARFLAGRRCHEVGLLIGGDGWEYPLWRMLSDAAGRDVRIHHIAVANRSARRPEARSATGTCAVLRVDPIDAGPGWTEPAGYTLGWRLGAVSVYLPPEAGESEIAP